MPQTPIDIIAAESAQMLESLESARRGYMQAYIMGVPMAFAIACAVAAINITPDGNFPWMIILFVTFAVAVVGFQIMNGLYRKKTKAAFLDKIAAALGLDYHARGVFDLKSFSTHRILPPADREQIEDGFSGTINGVPASFQEVILTDIRPAQNKNESDREEIVFQGLCLRIGIGKQLDAHTVVIPRNAFQSFFRTAFSKFEKVNLVSPAFEARFNALSTDQVEARYVLDPAFIEYFMTASSVAGTKWVEASFRDREIAFAIQRTRPMFEIGWLFRPLSIDALQGCADEIGTVIRLIEALKLNPYTGLGAEK